MAEHVQTQTAFLGSELKPCLDAAGAGTGHVFFVDAAHFVFGTFFAEFRSAIEEIIDGLPTAHADQLKTLMTLNFQLFDDVSLMAA